MLRLVFISLLLQFVYSLNATSFKQCQKVVRKSYKFSNVKHLYHTKYGWLFFSQTKPKRYLRGEPTLGLYLLRGNKKKRSLRLDTKYSKNIAAITRFTIAKNRMKNKSINFNKLAKLKYRSFLGTALFSSCCSVQGIVTPRGVVTSDYILHFLRNKTPFATAGMRLKKRNGKIIVKSVNPFFEANPFRVGDEIINFNGKKYSFRYLTKKILFSKVGNKYYFKVRRNGRIINLKFFFKKRMGGGILADTFLEHFGLKFDHNLKIIFIKHDSFTQKIGLKKGDTLIAIETVVINSDESLRKQLSFGLKSKKFRLLFQRDGLQFSIYFPSNIMLTL